MMFDDPAVTELARRIHALSRDLDLIRELKAPTIRDFANAPVLENWSVGRRSEIALVGEVIGHPDIIDGHRSTTSGLYYLDPRAGYARTQSRWWRLGTPARAPE